MHGKHYLRVWEIGKPEGLEEVEVALKPKNNKLGINELEKEVDVRRSGSSARSRCRNDTTVDRT